MNTQFLPLSWDTYQSLAQKLAKSLLEKEKPFDEIIAIARGGLTLGHILSDYLRLSISSITIQSYTDIQKQGELTITAKLGHHIRNKRILLVDDIADSGKTLKRAVSYLRRFKATSITTVAMFYKPQSVIKPDFYVEQTSKWVIFPTEVVETILSLRNKENLARLGFTKEQISFVRRHYPSPLIPLETRGI